MNMIAVQSSNIAAIGYEPESGVMHVRFKDGSTYAHPDTTPAEYRAFMASSSKGAHHAANFRKRAKKIGA
jgi:hypothetical protein